MPSQLVSSNKSAAFADKVALYNPNCKVGMAMVEVLIPEMMKFLPAVLVKNTLALPVALV